MASQADLDRDFPIQPNNRHQQNGYDMQHPELLAIKAIPDYWTRLNAEFAYFGVPEVRTQESKTPKKPR